MSAAFYVESADGSVTLAGPFEGWHEANDRAEEIESEFPYPRTEIVERDR